MESKVAGNARPSQDERCEQKRLKPKGIGYPYGIDLNGNIRDETAKSLPGCKIKPVRASLSRREK